MEGILHLFLYSAMNEIDYQTLVLTYQQKSFDLFSQTVALEARLKTSAKRIEELTGKVNQLTTENEKLKAKPKTTTKKTDNSSSEGF